MIFKRKSFKLSKYEELYLEFRDYKYSKFDLGKKLELYRLNKGLTQLEVSKIMGITRQQVSNWERGSCVINSLDLIKLLKIYGINKVRL